MPRAISSFNKRGNLLAGLVLLVLVAAGPAFAVLLNFQRELRQEREDQARNVALQRAELISASVGNVVEGSRQMLVAVSVTRRVQQGNPACGVLLDGIRQNTPYYSLLAVVRRDGTPVCSSAAAALGPETLAMLGQSFGELSGFVTGRYVAVPGLDAPVLSFALPIPGSSGENPAALVIAGLDLRALDALLTELHQPADGRLLVADRDGTILARTPQTAAKVGDKLGLERGLLGAGTAGIAAFDDPDGTQRIVGYVPPGKGLAGLFVAAGFSLTDLVSGINAAARRGYLLMSLGAALSVLLALVIGHRYLRAPASVLLEAARRWGSGDLTARAMMPDGATSEFAGLGNAFNEMAELLQHQRAELQGLNDALELRVADRTRALLESNNRLQVEIAERELTEASLRQAQKLQAVGQLAGGMAHDFNNLLTAILGSLELLRKRLPDVDTRQAKLLDIAVDAVARGSRLTAQLLAFSRKQPLLAVCVNVSEAIGGMAGLLASTLGGSVQLETRVEGDLWPAMLDPNQFEAAILNLALNARDAMPAGGRLIIAASNVNVTPASSSAELDPGSYVCVTVSDTGLGMPPDVVNRAFEPFFTTKAPGKGSGLGLSQVHGMVRQSGGSIMIESRQGGGTRITVMLPRSLATPLTEAEGLNYAVPALNRSEAVLLVDDDTQVREVTEAVLVDAGYTVITAENGESALDCLEAEGHKISLVIADYAMPGMTGRELLQSVKLRWPKIALLLATGYADYPALTSNDLPVDQIVRKPFRTNELLARIHMVIQRQASSEQAEATSKLGAA